MSKGDKKWAPVGGQIMTRWVQDIDSELPQPEYPRPQMERSEWLNLNGLWDYAIRPKDQEQIDSYDGKILVPFPIESALSGVNKKLLPTQKIFYRRQFEIPTDWNNKKILLHFGAIDWEATIWVNSEKVGSHKGGYIPFYYDISKYLSKHSKNEIIITVLDETGKGFQVVGKQSLDPKIITYTAVSGIWQTVWLEPVPNTYIKNLKTTSDIDNENIIIDLIIENPEPEDKIYSVILDDGVQIITSLDNINKRYVLNIDSPKLWSPESPFLYKIIIQIRRNDEIIEEIKSYFGMRKISLGTDNNGLKRIELNNKPIFQYGLLDQGYWPDGLYTAPTDDALKFDIETTKDLGFNLIRKHVKVEPARWYFHCDKMGILVWQDMPNRGQWQLIRHLLMRITPNKWFKNKKSQPYFYYELESLIDFLYNYPSVIVWTPFNEGWGQFETKEIVNKIRNQDSTRLINNASGWFDKGIGDIRDIHNYPNPKMPNKLKGRAAVIGEFGGLGLEVDHHMWNFKKKFVYRDYPDREALMDKYEKLIIKLKELIAKGLNAAIYTQTTDVEQEINGLLTYDREILKFDKDKLRELNQSLFSN